MKVFPPELTVPAVTAASGTVRLPGSKSISNRALILAALAHGRTTLTGLLRADDTERMIESLRLLGVAVDVKDDACTVTGCGGFFPVKSADLFIGNAGTAARTLTAALAFSEGNYRIDGIERMRERPIADLLAALRELGAEITCEQNEGFLPLRISPVKPRGNVVHIRGNVSSQYLTALLIISPLIAPAEGLKIVIEGELISRPYIKITTTMMAAFGVRVTELPDGFLVTPGQYRAVEQYAVEGDASGASYFLAFGALAGGPVRVEGVGQNALQGDAAFADLLKMMGARIVKGENFIEASAPADGILKGIDADCTLIPDAAMTLVPMALKTRGKVRLTGIGSWRVKETDRIHAMATEMRKFGAEVTEGPDWLEVSRGVKPLPEKVTVATYDDHRMAMSFSLAATVGVTTVILDPGCTAKTYPAYFTDFFRLIHSK